MQGLFGKGRDIVFEKLIEFRVGDRHDLAAPGCLRHLQDTHLPRPILVGAPRRTGVALGADVLSGLVFAVGILGALAAPEVAKRSQRQGVTVVNVGNSHVAAFLVFKGRILGVYEHHTGMLDTDALLFDLKEFGFGWLPDEQVRAKGGHGCAFLAPLPPEAEGFAPTFAVGPRREMLLGHAQFIAPHGDMMISGCHGLLHGLALREA